MFKFTTSHRILKGAVTLGTVRYMAEARHAFDFVQALLFSAVTRLRRGMKSTKLQAFLLWIFSSLLACLFCFFITV